MMTDQQTLRPTTRRPHGRFGHDEKRLAELAEEAGRALRDDGLDATELLRLAKSLKDHSDFRNARLLVAKARNQAAADPSVDRDLLDDLRREHAHSTYRDLSLPADQGLREALKILESDGVDLDTTEDLATLTLAGSIHVRLWAVDLTREHLEHAYDLYLRGHELAKPSGLVADRGKNGIEAAFVLDRMAYVRESSGRRSAWSARSVQKLRDRADDIRRDIISDLSHVADEEIAALAELDAPDDFETHRERRLRTWSLATTLAEAHFGVGEWQEAEDRAWQARQVAPDVPGWMLRSAVSDLGTLAAIQTERPERKGWERDLSFPGPARVVAGLLGNDDIEAVFSAYQGKVGLALSGGGFRASFYHLGVLARLADVDLLRQVEVISCVSGGSILGAYYYLKLRQLLQRHKDDDIRSECYVDLVRELVAEFLAGVAKNLRARLMYQPWPLLRMMFQPGYSRTVRAGELFDKHLYSRVTGPPRCGHEHENGTGAASGNGGGKRRKLPLSELSILPAGHDEQEFHPRYDNWCRRNKVPMLVINSTSLNTGHNWQFTSSWMGEPPSTRTSNIDANWRLRRVRYRKAPDRRAQEFDLAHAVASSACVPGMFDPVVLNKLYPERIIRLVDGGLYDNQGIQALIHEECDVALVSDASGQMRSTHDPGGGILSPLLRSNAVLMERVRQAQFSELSAMRRAKLLRNLMFVHLKKDLDVEHVAFIDCESSETDELLTPEDAATSYGVAKNIQRLIADIRTDLDSFSETEAYALMTSGYLMAKHELAASFPDIDHSEPPAGRWRFLAIEPELTRPQELQRRGFLWRLEVGRTRMFKLPRLLWKLCKFWSSPDHDQSGAGKRRGLVSKVLGTVAWLVVVLAIMLLAWSQAQKYWWAMAGLALLALWRPVRMLFFKTIRLASKAVHLLLFTFLVLVLSIVVGIWATGQFPEEIKLPPVLVFAVVSFGLAAGIFLWSSPKLRAGAAKVVLGAVLLLAGLFVWIDLKIFDWLYLRLGRIKRLDLGAGTVETLAAE